MLGMRKENLYSRISFYHSQLYTELSAVVGRFMQLWANAPLPPVIHLTFLVQVLEQFSFQLEWGVGVAPFVEPSSWHKLDLDLNTWRFDVTL